MATLEQVRGLPVAGDPMKLFIVLSRRIPRLITSPA